MDLQKRLQSINNAADVIEIVDLIRSGTLVAEDVTLCEDVLMRAVVEFAASGHNQAKPMAQVLNNYLKRK